MANSTQTPPVVSFPSRPSTSPPKQPCLANGHRRRCRRSRSHSASGFPTEAMWDRGGSNHGRRRSQCHRRLDLEHLRRRRHQLRQGLRRSSRCHTPWWKISLSKPSSDESGTTPVQSSDSSQLRGGRPSVADLELTLSGEPPTGHEQSSSRADGNRGSDTKIAISGFPRSRLVTPWCLKAN